jgi:hypothetical protein
MGTALGKNYILDHNEKEKKVNYHDSLPVNFQSVL